MDLSLIISLASSQSLPPAPLRRLTTNDSGLTPLLGLFLKQPKTTCFPSLDTNVIMKETHCDFKTGCFAVEPQKQPKNVTVTCTGPVKSG